MKYPLSRKLLATSDQRPATGISGMTLLEVMIGIGLLMIIVVSLGQMSSLMTKGRQRMERRDWQYHAARVALDKIAADVSQAFLVASPALKGMSGGAPVVETAFRGNDRGDEDELDFTTLAGRRFVADAKESDQQEIGYRVVPDPERSAVKQLVRRESRRIDGDVREGGATFPLIEGVTAFQLEYYDAARGEWDATGWDSTERARQGKLPAAVRVTLKLTDINRPENILTFTSVVRLGLAPGPVEF